MRQNWFAVLLALVFLSGCGPGQHPISGSEGSRYLYVTVWASAQCVNPGDTLVARATVTNNYSETQVIALNDRPVFDLYIGDRDRLIRWSDGKPLTPDITRIELKPGESKTIEIKESIEEPVPSVIGVSARFIADAKDTEHPIAPYISVYGPSACPGAFGP